jgi:hypothetical protein
MSPQFCLRVGRRLCPPEPISFAFPSGRSLGFLAESCSLLLSSPHLPSPKTYRASPHPHLHQQCVAASPSVFAPIIFQLAPLRSFGWPGTGERTDALLAHACSSSSDVIVDIAGRSLGSEAGYRFKPWDSAVKAANLAGTGHHMALMRRSRSPARPRKVL